MIPAYLFTSGLQEDIMNLNSSLVRQQIFVVAYHRVPHDHDFKTLHKGSVFLYMFYADTPVGHCT